MGPGQWQSPGEQAGTDPSGIISMISLVIN